jgi:hypothetical protein
MSWFKFSDSFSGGYIKHPPFEDIYIEADGINDAKEIFERMFGDNPDWESCDCCGENYFDWSGRAYHTLEDATHEEYCRRYKGVTLEDYVIRKEVAVLRKENIEDWKIDG